MTDTLASSAAHRKVLAALGRDIARTEEELLEKRCIREKLIRVYERSKQSELIHHLREQIAQLQEEAV